jgi:hypothetical protein
VNPPARLPNRSTRRQMPAQGPGPQERAAMGRARWVVLSDEIYNYAPLQDGLQRRAYSFASQTNIVVSGQFARLASVRELTRREAPTMQILA